MASRDHGTGQAQLAQYLGGSRVPLGLLLNQSGMSSRDLRNQVIYVQNLGNGWHLVKNLCNDQAYQVQSLNGQSYLPGTAVLLAGEGAGFGKEFILGVAPGGAGASQVSVSTSATFGTLPVTPPDPALYCPVPIIGKSYLAFQITTELLNYQRYNAAEPTPVLVPSSRDTQVLWANLYTDGLFASTIATMPPLVGTLWEPGGTLDSGIYNEAGASELAVTPIENSISRVAGDGILFGVLAPSGGPLAVYCWYPRNAFISPLLPTHDEAADNSQELSQVRGPASTGHASWPVDSGLSPFTIGPATAPDDDTVYIMECTLASGTVWSCQLYSLGSAASLQSLLRDAGGSGAAIGSALIVDTSVFPVLPRCLAITPTHAVVFGGRLPRGGGSWTVALTDASGDGTESTPTGCGVTDGSQEIALLGNLGIPVAPGTGSFSLTSTAWSEAVPAAARTASGLDYTLYPLVGPESLPGAWYFRGPAITSAPPLSCPTTPLFQVQAGPDGGQPLAFLPRN